MNIKLLQENFQFIHFFQRDFFEREWLEEAIKNRIEVNKIGQRETRLQDFVLEEIHSWPSSCAFQGRG